MRSTLLIVLSLFTVGCVANVPPKPKEPPVLPEPSSFGIIGDVTIDLTPQMMSQTGLPPQLKATLDAHAKSEAITASPLRSRYQGHMSFVITDGTGKRQLAHANINVSGESAGSPTEGLGEAFSRFFDAASLLSRSLPSPATRPAE